MSSMNLPCVKSFALLIEACASAAAENGDEAFAGEATNGDWWSEGVRNSTSLGVAAIMVVDDGDGADRSRDLNTPPNGAAHMVKLRSSQIMVATL